MQNPLRLHSWTVRIGPLLADDEDPADLKTQWRAYARTHWYETVAAPCLARGVARGLAVPHFEYDIVRILSLPSTARFRPPWVQGLRPPTYSVRTIAVSQMPRTSVLDSRAQQALPWLQPVAPGQLPLLDLRPPPSVIQVDPLADANSGPIGNLVEDLERHMIQSALATLEAASASNTAQELPMTAVAIGGALNRGAKIVWEGGKAAVKAGKNFLGWVGLAGSAWDLYQFLQWAADQPVPKKNLPTAHYEPGPNHFVFEWPGGLETTAPATEAPPYLRS